LIQYGLTSSQSSETIVSVKKRIASYLNELRFHKGSGINIKLPLTRKDVPAVRAVLGNIGVFQGKDYRGINVVAYTAPIPNTSG